MVTSDSLASKRRRKRACMECAKAREKCTKSEPCLRCSNKLLPCVYPPDRPAKVVTPRDSPSTMFQAAELPEEHHHQSQQQMDIAFNPGLGVATSSHDKNLQISQSNLLSPETCLQDTMVPSDVDMIISDVQTPGVLVNTNNPPAYMGSDTSFPLVQQQLLPSERLDYPINWLPSNGSICIDYNSNLGLNFSTYTSFENMRTRLPEEMLLDESTGDFLHQYGALDTIGFLGAPTNSVPDRSMNQPVVLPRSVFAQMPAVASPPLSQCSGSAMSVITGSTQGTLYATSTDGARIPCTVRSKRPHRAVYGATPIKSILDADALDDEDNADLKFPSLDGILLDNTGDDSSSYIQMNMATYDIIKKQFEKLCLARNGLYSPYLAPDFPNLMHLNVLIGLYFERFDPIFPIVHHKTNMNESWLLSLALSAIGCQYIDTDEFSQSVRPFHEFLRRALALELEQAVSWTRCSLPLIQAIILSQVGMIYHGSSRFLRKARVIHGTLVEIVKSAGLLTNTPGTPYPDPENGIDQERRWKSWLATETRRRLGYSVWV
jgi:hypothetical protein